MKIPLWIGGPALISLAAVDAALELQARVVGSLTRSLLRGMGTDVAEPLSYEDGSVRMGGPHMTGESGPALR
ncbi:hypothetical protein [Rhodococcus oryzae]|uniref:hypothetical protein n=1 Tax=Rhodococcus oryzae TaxID=2571143 RepID=UPI0037A58D47